MSKVSTHQHYVPQFLLRGFAHGKRTQIYIFDKQSRTQFRQSVSKTACEKNFYEHSELDRSVDEWIFKFETNVAPVVQKIRETESLDWISEDDRFWLSAFTAVQMVRTRSALEQQKHFHASFAEALRSRGCDPEELEETRSRSEEELRAAFLLNIPSVSKSLVPHLLDKTLILVRAPRPLNFVISDHLVVMDNNLNPKGPHRGNLGLRVEGIEVYIPLSSCLMLGFICAQTVESIQHAKAISDCLGHPIPPETRKFLSAAAEDGRAVDCVEDNVLYFNSLQVGNGERFIFSPYNDFALAEEMTETHPEMKQGHRPSWC